MSRIIDLTVGIGLNMPAHWHFPRPVVLPHFTHENSVELGLGVPGDPLTSATAYIGMIDHVGTHVDSFFHTNPRGATIDEMPLDMFMGKAVCFDLTHIPDLGEIDVADLQAAECKSGVAVDGHIVLLNTGLHRRHFPTDKVMWSNPGVTAQATRWLADRGSRVHGVEGPSTDRPTDSTFPSHRACRELRLVHYEWLCNLEQLVGRGEFQFHGLPLKIIKGTGGPARAIAIID
jgi:kynurenine formamidase